MRGELADMLSALEVRMEESVGDSLAKQFTDIKATTEATFKSVSTGMQALFATLITQYDNKAQERFSTIEENMEKVLATRAKMEKENTQMLKVIEESRTNFPSLSEQKSQST